MFSFKMEFDYALRSLALRLINVYLLDGIVLGMILIVFLIGSVSIFSILESRF